MCLFLGEQQTIDKELNIKMKLQRWKRALLSRAGSLTGSYRSPPRHQESFVPIDTSGRAENQKYIKCIKMLQTTQWRVFWVWTMKTGNCAARATYMCHKGVMDGGLGVVGPGRLLCLPLGFRGWCCGLPIVVLEAWVWPVLWGRMVQDSRHTQLHLEVQKVIPRVFEEQILGREGAREWYIEQAQTSWKRARRTGDLREELFTAGTSTNSIRTAPSWRDAAVPVKGFTNHCVI